MPKPQTEEFVEQPVREVSVQAESKPIRVRVVYLGAKRNMSVALGGSILTEHFEDKDGPVERQDRDGVTRRYIQQRRPVEGGITSYDFSTHDLKGNLIRERLMPDTAPERLRGKRFEWVDHPDHIAQFHLGPKDHERKRRKGEFEVLAKPEDQPLVQELIRRVRVRENRRESELKEVLT